MSIISLSLLGMMDNRPIPRFSISLTKPLLNHTEYPPVYWKIRKKLFLELILLMLILSALIYLTLPFYAQRLNEKTANEMLSAAKPLQNQIEKRLLSENPVDFEQDALPQPDVKLVTYYLTTHTGKIVFFNEQLGSLMVLTPNIRDKEVRWDCFGRPLRYMPATCRYQ